MKIVVLSAYNGIVNRGVETWCIEICKYWGIAGHEVTLIEGGKSSEKPINYNLISLDLNVQPSSYESSIISYILYKTGFHQQHRDAKKFTRNTLRFLNEIKPDFIFPLNGQPKLIKKNLMLNDTYIVGIGQGGIPNDVLKYDAFVALNKRQMKKLSTLNVSSTLIHNGVDIEGFQKHGKKASRKYLEKFGIQWGKGPHILTVAALVPYKRIYTVIKVLSTLDQGTLIVLGEGPEKENLKRLSAEILDQDRHQIYFPGSVSYTEVKKFYEAADIFTLPSDKSEAFGIVIIEAMAAGLPVLVNRDEIRKEIVEIEDYLVDPENIVEFKQKLMKAWEERKYYGVQSKKIAQKFDWKLISNKYLKFMEKLKDEK